MASAIALRSLTQPPVPTPAAAAAPSSRRRKMASKSAARDTYTSCWACNIIDGAAADAAAASRRTGGGPGGSCGLRLPKASADAPVGEISSPELPRVWGGAQVGAHSRAMAVGTPAGLPELAAQATRSLPAAPPASGTTRGGTSSLPTYGDPTPGSAARSPPLAGLGPGQDGSIVSAARRASRQGVKGTHCLYVRRWETSIYSRDVMYCSKPTEAESLVRSGRNVL